MTTKTGNHLKSMAGVALLLLFPALLSCNPAAFFAVLGDAVTPNPVVIAPASAALALGSGLTFKATGGVPPYAFSIASGAGTIDSSTGVFVAASVGTTIVRVTDKNGNTSEATVTVNPTGLLTLNPATPTVGINGTILFVAAGGTPPYTFSIGTPRASNPSINASTGLYTSGFTTGTDRVVVTDSGAPSPSTVFTDVTVTTTVTNVNYLVQSVNPPATGKGGTPVPAGFDFTIRNGGPAAGTQPVSWWIYVSDTNTSPNSPGTVLLASNTTGSLASGGTAVIPISGTWPTVPAPAGATKYLFVMVSSSDDLDASNNVAGPFTVALTPPDVDYSVSSVASAAGLVAGGPLSGSFTLQNGGPDPGGQTVYWTAYVSTDSSATIDAGAVVIDSGSRGPLGASPASAAVGFTGTWPGAAGGPYYLKVRVSAGDDVNSTNNVQVSGANTTTTVDYVPTNVSNTGASLANNRLDGTFMLQNLGSANGTLQIIWTAWLSTNASLDAGDSMIATGTHTALTAGAPAIQISFSGVWPATTGAYFIIVTVSCAEDSVPGNNSAYGGGYPTSYPVIDQIVSAVNYVSGSSLPDGTVNGSFEFTNTTVGVNGARQVNWTAYASTNSALDGSAIPIASGSAPPLSGGAVSGLINFSGRWPLHYGNYFLIVAASSPDDPTTGNDASATGTSTAVGFLVEQPANEPNNDFTYLSNAVDLGVTLKPGMSVNWSGSIGPADLDDVLVFKAGTASSITFYMSWAGSYNVTIYILRDVSPLPAVILQSQNTTGTNVSLGWSVSPAGAACYVDISDTGSGNVGPYTLIITGN